MELQIILECKARHYLLFQSYDLHTFFAMYIYIKSLKGSAHHERNQQT